MNLDAVLSMADRHLEQGCRLFEPYEKQRQFYKMGGKFDVRCLSGGNRCLTPWTFIETPEGVAPCGEVWTSADQRVLSWDGGSQYVAQSQGGLFLGIEQAFRVVLDNGRFFDCSRRHRVLTVEGWISLDQLMSISSGRHYWHTREDYEASCVEDGYLCDQPLRQDQGIDPALPRQQGDALQSYPLALDMPDEAVRILQRIRAYPEHDRLSTRDDLRRYADLFALFSRPAQQSPFLDLPSCIRGFQQSPVASGRLPQSNAAPYPDQSGGCILRAAQRLGCSCGSCRPLGHEAIHQSHPQSTVEFDPQTGVEGLFRGEAHIATWEAFESPCLVGGRKIKAIVPLGYQPIIDASVPGHNNYIAGGVVHHNTGKTTAFYAGELPYHLTGEYPEWWEGRRWDRPVVAWVGSEDWSTNVAGCQRILVGDVETDSVGRSKWNARTGMFEACGLPRESIVGMTKLPNVPHALSSLTVRHKSGGLSKVRFIAYSKGRKALQAGQVDIVGMDEEPPEDVATELMARTVDTDGIAVLTFTPLLGMSEVVKRFVGEVSIDDDFPEVLTSDVGAMIRIRAQDTPHLGPKQIAAMQRKYPEHEHMARIEGIPALGEGAIFPFKDSEIYVPWFQPPVHWRILDGVDFGWTHPTARVRGIMDPDTKRIFLIKDYKVKQELPSTHAAAWKREFKGAVPVIWPHDGRNTETDGRSKMAKYQTEGVRFTTVPAELPTGGNSLEGGLQLMYQQFASGLLKVWNGACPMWAAERMLYRREKKKNGTVAVTEVFDDCMDASRYVVCGLLSGQGVTISEAFSELMIEQRGKLRRVDEEPSDPLFD